MPNKQPGSLEWAHDFAAILGDHHAYWKEREAATAQMVDIAEHQVAHDIAESFDATVRDVKQFAFQNSLAGLSADVRADILKSAGFDHEVDPLALRRKTLGTLAISRLITSIFVPEQLYPGRRESGVITADAVGALAAPDFILDMDADESGMPLDYRIHVPHGVATDRLVFPEAPALDAWYFGRGDNSDVEVPRQDQSITKDPHRDPSQGNLWVHRTGIDFSDGLVLYLQSKGLAPRADMATLFPYIPDRSRLPTL